MGSRAAIWPATASPIDPALAQAPPVKRSAAAVNEAPSVPPAVMTVPSFSRTAGAKPLACGRLPVAVHTPGVETAGAAVEATAETVGAAAIAGTGPIAIRVITATAAAIRRRVLARRICVPPIFGPSTGGYRPIERAR